MDPSQYQVLRCPACGAKNRIPLQRSAQKAVCGKCGHSLIAGQPHTDASSFYNLRCRECGTRNRIPADKVKAGPRCGKCGAALDTDALFVPQPLVISDGNFENMVMQSPLPVLLFAWAPWCPTCRSYMPVIDDFGRDAKGKIRVGKLNVDGNPQLSSRFNILSVPSLFIFDHGQLKESLPGGMPKHDLMIKLAPYL